MPEPEIAATLYPGEDHPYQPPSDPLERSPCPGFNVLANHGLIDRSGRNIPISQVVARFHEAFGVAPYVSHLLINGAKFHGLPTAVNEDGEETFHLRDFHRHDVVEHDSSLVRRDHYFEPESQFNLELYNEMISLARDGVLTREQISQHQQNRIQDSLDNNPEVSFDAFRSGAMATEAAVLMIIGGDKDFQSVPVSKADVFLRENRFPDDFVAWPQLGNPDVTFNPFGRFVRTMLYFMGPVLRNTHGLRSWKIWFQSFWKSNQAAPQEESGGQPDL